MITPTVSVTVSEKNSVNVQKLRLSDTGLPVVLSLSLSRETSWEMRVALELIYPLSLSLSIETFC